MKPFIKITTAITVLPEGEPIFSEMATTIKIEDDAAGPFISIQQSSDNLDKGKVNFDEKEWPMVKEAVEELLKVCEQLNQGQEGK